jgi:hypothetical protein
MCAPLVLVQVPKTLRDPLAPVYGGPFRVVEHQEKSFKLDLGASTKLVSMDRLKPAVLESQITGDLDSGATVLTHARPGCAICAPKILDL